MAHPVLGLYTWYILPERRPLLISVAETASRDDHDLHPNGLRVGVSAFRDAHRKLRRRSCFSDVRGGVGGIETKIADNGRAFDLHLHEVLDAEEIDEASVNRAWGQLTSSRGTFQVKELEDEEDDNTALTKYVTKAASWCPPAGEVGLKFLAEIQRAIHGRRMLVAWGTGELRERRAATSKEAQ